jgi:hypothetical protein
MLSRLAIVGLICSFVLADSLVPPLTSEQSSEASRILQEFKKSPKGPFQQILWFCKDGTTRTPKEGNCTERGGGIQYATRNPQAKKLSSWNIDTGTIFAAMSFEEFFDVKRNHHRMRQVAMEQYLRQVDNGWVDRRAFTYRGSRQAEDEMAAGRELLSQMLADPTWTRDNFFLALQTVAAVPHGVDDSLVKKIRSLATAVADADDRFQPLRAKIHSAPDASDLPRVKEFRPNAAAAGQLRELIAAMEQERKSNPLPQMLDRLARRELADVAKGFAEALRSGTDALPQAGRIALALREAVESSKNGKQNLERADLLLAISDWTFHGDHAALAPRVELLARTKALVEIAVGTGLLSRRQLDAFGSEWLSLTSAGRVPGERYLAHMRYLARSLEWSRATVAKEYQPVVNHLTPAEPKADQLVDHLLRGSVALQLARVVDVLSGDAQRAAGIRHSFFGEPVSSAVMALNPGVALAPLSRWQAGPLDPAKIYIIPETAADLTPVRGILSLDSGNALSHTQLLAANAGIPNATLPSDLLPRLDPYLNREVLYAVSPGGTVVMQDAAKLSSDDRALWMEKKAERTVRLDTSKVRLNDRRIRNLEEVSTGDVGVICGPKAGNLGQLKRFFPEAVAPGLVVPFGAYAAQIDPTFPNDVATAFEAAAQLPQSERRTFIGPKLREFRERIERIAFDSEFEKELLSKLRQTFGPDRTYGAFVRSDTNAEDLPEFSGAGLNLTVVNVVGEREILAALRQVWASPFVDRAYEWRARVLENTGDVYPSVVILKTVPVDKSGVIATMDLETGDTASITVNVSEGIAAVVDGGVAESLLLKPDGTVKLLQQARNPYRKVVQPGGGLKNVPASGSDTVLETGEIAQLRAMVARVEREYPPEMGPDGKKLPWDIEFGFEKGALRLFQIRPLARFRELQTLEKLSRLDSGASPVEVSLTERP